MLRCPLREGAASAGELPKSVGIDATHRQAGGEQGAEDAALVAAARLEPDRCDGLAAQPPDQRAPACLVVVDREACALRQQQHVKPVLRHINSTEALLYHPRVPSFADAGSSPGNCAGMEETTGAPSSFAALSPRRLRASSRDGGGVVNRPPSSLTMLLSRHTRRREVIAGVIGAAAWPRAAGAQPQALPVVGLLSSASPDRYSHFLQAFREGLGDTGHVEGRNVAIEYRWADGNNDRLPALGN